MASPKGYLILPVGFNPDGDVRSFTVDANDYLNVVLETGLTGGGMGDPKGKLATLVGFNPDGELRAFKLDANDNLLVTLLGDVGGYTEGARVYNDADQTINNNTELFVLFNSERYDTDEIHSTTLNTSRLTCVTAGIYMITAHIRFSANALGARHLRIKLNRTTDIATINVKGVVTYPADMIASTIYKLEIDDYVEVRLWQDSGSALTISSHANLGPEFMMQRVG